LLPVLPRSKRPPSFRLMKTRESNASCLTLS